MFIISQKEKSPANYGVDLRQNEQNDLKKIPIIRSILSKNSEWRGHGHEEDCDHDEPDQEFCNHSAKISQQAAPTRSSGVDHSFPGYEFSGDRTNHRPDK